MASAAMLGSAMSVEDFLSIPNTAPVSTEAAPIECAQKLVDGSTRGILTKWSSAASGNERNAKIQALVVAFRDRACDVKDELLATVLDRIGGVAECRSWVNFNWTKPADVSEGVSFLHPSFDRTYDSIEPGGVSLCIWLYVEARVLVLTRFSRGPGETIVCVHDVIVFLDGLFYLSNHCELSTEQLEALVSTLKEASGPSLSTPCESFALGCETLGLLISLQESRLDVMPKPIQISSIAPGADAGGAGATGAMPSDMAFKRKYTHITELEEASSASAEDAEEDGRALGDKIKSVEAMSLLQTSELSTRRRRTTADRRDADDGEGKGKEDDSDQDEDNVPKRGSRSKPAFELRGGARKEADEDDDDADDEDDAVPHRYEDGMMRMFHDDSDDLLHGGLDDDDDDDDESSGDEEADEDRQLAEALAKIAEMEAAPTKGAAKYKGNDDDDEDRAPPKRFIMGGGARRDVKGPPPKSVDEDEEGSDDDGPPPTKSRRQVQPQQQEQQQELEQGEGGEQQQEGMDEELKLLLEQLEQAPPAAAADEGGVSDSMPPPPPPVAAAAPAAPPQAAAMEEAADRTRDYDSKEGEQKEDDDDGMQTKLDELMKLSDKLSNEAVGFSRKSKPLKGGFFSRLFGSSSSSSSTSSSTSSAPQRSKAAAAPASAPDVKAVSRSFVAPPGARASSMASPPPKSSSSSSSSSSSLRRAEDIKEREVASTAAAAAAEADEAPALAGLVAPPARAKKPESAPATPAPASASKEPASRGLGGIFSSMQKIVTRGGPAKDEKAKPSPMSGGLSGGAMLSKTLSPSPAMKEKKKLGVVSPSSSFSSSSSSSSSFAPGAANAGFAPALPPPPMAPLAPSAVAPPPPAPAAPAPPPPFTSSAGPAPPPPAPMPAAAPAYSAFELPVADEAPALPGPSGAGDASGITYSAFDIPGTEIALPPAKPAVTPAAASYSGLRGPSLQVEALSAAYAASLPDGALAASASEPLPVSSGYAAALPDAIVSAVDSGYAAALPDATVSSSSSSLASQPADNGYAAALPDVLAQAPSAGYAAALPSTESGDLSAAPDSNGYAAALPDATVSAPSPSAMPALKERVNLRYVPPPVVIEDATKLSVYAPLSVAPSAVFKVTVYMFIKQDEAAVRDIATSTGAVHRGTGMRDFHVKRGHLVSVMLYLDHAAFQLADEPVFSFGAGSSSTATGAGALPADGRAPQKLQHIKTAMEKGQRIGYAGLRKRIVKTDDKEAVKTVVLVPSRSEAHSESSTGKQLGRHARPDAVAHFAWEGKPESVVFHVRAKDAASAAASATALFGTHPCFIRAISGDRSITFKFQLTVEPAHKVMMKLASSAAAAARLHVLKKNAPVSDILVSRTLEMGARNMKEAGDSGVDIDSAFGAVTGAGKADVIDTGASVHGTVSAEDSTDVDAAHEATKVELVVEDGNATKPLRLSPNAILDWHIPLARGGHGEVLLSALKDGNRVAVLKRPIIDPHHAASDGNAIIRAFKQEAAVQAALGSHPNLVQPLGMCLEAEQSLFVALEYCPLGSLRSALDKHRASSYAAESSSNGARVWDLAASSIAKQEAVVRGGLKTSFGTSSLSSYLQRAHEVLDSPSFDIGSTAVKVQIARDAAAGLAALHGAGYIHNDVAARNLLLTLDESAFTNGGAVGLGAKICDVGLAVRLGVPEEESRFEPIFEESSSDASAGSAAPSFLSSKAPQQHASEVSVEGIGYGTPAWLAPETLRYNVLSQSTDVYSYGCVLYELFTGKEPWQELKGHRGSIYSALLQTRKSQRFGLLSELEKEGFDFRDVDADTDPEARGERKKSVPTEVRRILETCLSYQGVFEDADEEAHADKAVDGSADDLLLMISKLSRPSSAFVTQQLDTALLQGAF